MYSYNFTLLFSLLIQLCARATATATATATTTDEVTQTDEATRFLSDHPEILVGRKALEEETAKIDEGNTFGVWNKPTSNIVLVQQYNADTDERLFAVALIDDEEAEDYYKKYNQDTGGDDTTDEGDPRLQERRCRVKNREPNLFERASRCYQFCGRGHSCTRDARCPACRYVGGGNCHWQLRCVPR